MIQDVDLAGNAFLLRDSDRLQRLRPDWMTMLEVDRGRGVYEVVGYTYDENGDGSEIVDYDVDEVIHWSPIPDPLAHWRGMSWLTPVVREVNADTEMTTHKSQFFEHAATPNMVLRYNTKLSPEQAKQTLDRWQARYGGSANAWRTALLDQGADVTVLGRDLGQMNFTAAAAGENRIAAAGGVPGIVVGLKEGLDAATYSNYGAGDAPVLRPDDAPAVALGVRRWRKPSTSPPAPSCGTTRPTSPRCARPRRTAARRPGCSRWPPASWSATGSTRHRHVGADRQRHVTAVPHRHALRPVAEPGSTGTSEERQLAEIVQKVYLGVGNTITVDEARALLKSAGFPISGPAPTAGQTPPPAAGGIPHEPDHPRVRRRPQHPRRHRGPHRGRHRRPVRHRRPRLRRRSVVRRAVPARRVRQDDPRARRPGEAAVPAQLPRAHRQGRVAARGRSGLYGEFRVSKVDDGDRALELVRDGVIDSFSVGFSPSSTRSATASPSAPRSRCGRRRW